MENNKELSQAASDTDSGDLSVEALQNEHDFENYLKKLKHFAQKYWVIVISQASAWAPPFTRKLTRLMNDIGFRADLYEKFRYTYAAFLDSGNVIFEKLSKETINTKLNSPNNVVGIVSYDSEKNLKSWIGINEKQLFHTGRGLFFVVYDPNSQTVMDSVFFDIFSETIPAARPQLFAQKLWGFADAHPGVTVVPFLFPKFPKTDLTVGEQFIVEHEQIANIRAFDPSKFPDWPLKKYYEKIDFAEAVSVPRSYFDFNGVRRFEDVSGKAINISGGHRVTSYQPRTFDNTIFIIAQCTVFGHGSDDSNTIASHLQKLINERLPEYKIIVQNYGFFLLETDRHSDEQISILESLPVRPGDIILSDFGNVPEKICIDMSDITKFPRDCEVFLDHSDHFTPDGNRLIAEKMFEGLLENNIFEKARQFALGNEANAPQQPENKPEFDKDTNAELAEYKNFLIDFYNSSLKQTIGAVVMNCNPFTLGHRYLIEKALEQCSFLILFLVEEDKSVFPFEDRLMLVDEGTKDIPNLAIIPSGKFVLSSLTFSEYFNKSELQDRVIDTSLDVTVFAREIAPCLHITKRFAGEEPLDNVTRQYNETMQRVLPEYGIEFVEIPRAEIAENTPISASYVRSLLEKKDFEAIKALVPESTLRYLQEKYK